MTLEEKIQTLKDAKKKYEDKLKQENLEDKRRIAYEVCVHTLDYSISIVSI